MSSLIKHANAGVGRSFAGRNGSIAQWPQIAQQSIHLDVVQATWLKRLIAVSIVIQVVDRGRLFDEHRDCEMTGSAGKEFPATRLIVDSNSYGGSASCTDCGNSSAASSRECETHSSDTTGSGNGRNAAGAASWIGRSSPSADPEGMHRQAVPGTTGGVLMPARSVPPRVIGSSDNWYGSYGSAAPSASGRSKSWVELESRCRSKIQGSARPHREECFDGDRIRAPGIDASSCICPTATMAIRHCHSS